MTNGHIVCRTQRCIATVFRDQGSIAGKEIFNVPKLIWIVCICQFLRHVTDTCGEGFATDTIKLADKIDLIVGEQVVQYVYVRLLRCRYLWRTERSPKKAFSIVDGAKQLYNLTGLPRCHGEHRRWKMRRVEACSIKSHSASSPWLDLSTTEQVSESVSLQCIAFSPTSQHHNGTASYWKKVWSSCVLPQDIFVQCAVCSVECGVCSAAGRDWLVWDTFTFSPSNKCT